MKAVQRQIDQHYGMEILNGLISPGINGGAQGPLHMAARKAQEFIWQAQQTITGGAVAHPFNIPTHGTDTEPVLPTIWAANSADPDQRKALAKAKQAIVNISRIAILTPYDPANPGRPQPVVNALALGDFLRLFADMLESLPADLLGSLANYAALSSSLKNPSAFNKTTNRIRYFVGDPVDQVPNVGITQWHLPSEDVMGVIDRMFGYYEAGDISGSTTDAITTLAMFTAVGGPNQFPNIDDTRTEISVLINSGFALGAILGMVVQMHHSLPETMMAINLIPRASLGAGNPINVVYNPFLTNTSFQHVPLFDEWRRARVRGFGGNVTDVGNGRMMLVFQDVYQMPDRPDPKDEIGLILPFTYAVNHGFAADENQPTIFGYQFYNEVVETLNEGGPGPAIALALLLRNVPHATFLNGQLNPALPDNPDAFVALVRAGMKVPSSAYPKAPGAEHYTVANLHALEAPFVPGGAYYEIEEAAI